VRNYTRQSGNVIHSISGTVTGGNGSPLAGVTVSTAGATATTDASGVYSLTGLSSGSYTVTPSQSGFTFAPATRTVTTSNANVTGQNFSATASGTPGGGGNNSACKTYTVGDTFTFGMQVNNQPYQTTGTITEVNGSTVTTVQDIGSGFTMTALNRVSGCYQSEMLSLTNGNMVNTWTPPYPTMPSSLTTGFTETVTSALTIQSPTLQCTGPSTTTYTVNGPETVTVPVGTFDAIKITTVIQSGPYVCSKGGWVGGGATDYLWYVAGMGAVKTQSSKGEISELISYTIH
jgi:hypothetical protein